MNITFERILNRVKESGDHWVTEGRGRKFTCVADDAGIYVIPSSGKKRPILRPAIEDFCDQYNRDRSDSPGHYHDNSFNASYLIAIVKAIEAAQTSSELNVAFREGGIYVRRTDIHEKFGGSRQSGIASSRVVPAIFIFTGETGEQFGYADQWDSAGHVFTYTGEGQVGDMTFRAGNKAIRDHIADGRSIHLFQSIDGLGGRYTYLGEMQCAGTQIVHGTDRNGSPREIIQFQLVRLRAIDEMSDPVVDEKSISTTSIDELRKRAYSAVKTPASAKTSAVHSVYARSKEIYVYALSRSKGDCECCDRGAPFFRPNGQPYLEVHHLDRVSDGGLDAPDHVAAVCPTCHRRVHHGADAKFVNDELRMKIKSIERRLDTIV